MGWSSLLEDILDRLNSEFSQNSLHNERSNKLKTSYRVDQLYGIKSACERLLCDIKKHLSLATDEKMDLADAVIKLDQERKELIKTTLKLNMELEEKQKILNRKIKEAADQSKRNTQLEEEYRSYKTHAKTSLSELKAQHRSFERRIIQLERENRELGARCDTLSKEIKKDKRALDRRYIRGTYPEKGQAVELCTEMNSPRHGQQSPEFRVRLLRPINDGSSKLTNVETRNDAVPESKDIRNNTPQSPSNLYTKKGKKIRVYDLAKELRINIRRIMDDVKREGINVKVASNTIPINIADRIRSKYNHKSFDSTRILSEGSIKVLKK